MKPIPFEEEYPLEAKFLMALYKQGPIWGCDECGEELFSPYALHCGKDYCRHIPHTCKRKK